MSAKKKIEVVDIDLNLDLEGEIKKCTDNLDNLVSKQAQIVENAKSRLSIRPLSKKEREVQQLNAQLAAIFDQLKKAKAHTPMDVLAKDAGITLTESDTIRVGTKLKAYIHDTTNGEWILDKKKINGRFLYAVAKFASGQ